MNTRLSFLIILLTGLWLNPLSAFISEEYHTFTSKDGREMVAKIIRVSGDEVIIERKEDRRSFTVKINLFAEKDQSFIQDWDEMQRLSRPDALGVSIRRSTGGKDKTTTTSTTTEEWDAGYTIAIRNDTWGPIEDLEVHYRVFKFDAAVASQERGQGQSERKEGQFSIDSLNRDENFEQDTETFRLSASQLRQGWVYTNGGQRKSEDELGGCWVRIYKDGKLIHEDALPQSIMRQQKWTLAGK